MRLDALIFDVDGTLADTEEAHRAAFNQAFERLGLGWIWQPDEYRRLLQVTGGKERLASYIDGLPLRDDERRRLQQKVADIHAEKNRAYVAFVGGGQVPLRRGVARLIDEALEAGCRLAIASTTTFVNIDALLQSGFGARSGDLFGVIACGDQVQAKKPAADIYRLALGALQTTPEHAVAIEDSPQGVRAAVAAGIWTVATPNFWTAGGDFTGAALTLPDLGDPEAPLAGEPGGCLTDAAWLSFDELSRRATARR